MSKLNLVKSWSDYSGPHVNKLVKKRVEEANDKWQKLRLNLFSFPNTEINPIQNIPKNFPSRRKYSSSLSSV